MSGGRCSGLYNYHWSELGKSVYRFDTTSLGTVVDELLFQMWFSYLPLHFLLPGLLVFHQRSENCGRIDPYMLGYMSYMEAIQGVFDISRMHCLLFQ
jgi:hypothetical protein